MTEAQLLAKVESEGWTINESKTLGEEGVDDNLLTIKALLLTKPDTTFMLRQWVNYYVKVDGSCFWREHDPFPEKVVVVTFRDEVQTRITELIAAASIKAAYTEKVSETDKTAIVVAITPANALKMYHVYKDAQGDLLITELTGTYPI